MAIGADITFKDPIPFFLDHHYEIREMVAKYAVAQVEEARRGVLLHLAALAVEHGEGQGARVALIYIGFSERDLAAQRSRLRDAAHDRARSDPDSGRDGRDSFATGRGRRGMAGRGVSAGAGA